LATNPGKRQKNAAMQTSETRRQQFVELVEAHQGILHRICSIYGKSIEDRQDLFQEMVLQLWRSYPSFGGRSSFTTWMYRVALNTALLERRRAARRPDLSQGGEAELANVPAETPPPAPEVALLRGCIQELPSLDRAVVLLHLEGSSYDEISEIIGLSRTNVSVRLVRLKERLRRALEGKGLGKEAFL
jgi:RNA polymerase sigma-70 factor (ECF subfamily)